MNKRVLAIAALATGLLLAPSAALAAPATYGALTGPNTVTTGTTGTYTVADYLEHPTATITVDGPGSVVITAAALVSETVPAVDGEVTFDVDFPETGEYLISVHTPKDEFVGDIVVTAVLPTDDELGETGFDGAALIWFGGGAVALGIAFIVTTAIIRRNAKVASRP